MNTNEAALIRGWIQGVAWDVLGELYLDDAECAKVIRAVRQLREALAGKARRLGLYADAQLWGQEREYSQDWIQRALRSVDLLKSKPDPKPQPNDPLSRWLPSNIASRLAGLKVSSLLELADFINRHGCGWWKTVPNLGRQSAEKIQAFFVSSEQDLRIRLDLSHRNLTRVEVQMQCNDITPLERFVPPIPLTGETGRNRAPSDRCRIDAHNDYESILAWLSLWDDGTPTHERIEKKLNDSCCGR